MARAAKGLAEQQAAAPSAQSGHETMVRTLHKRGALDLVFPNRGSFPWQPPAHPMLQQTQSMEDDGHRLTRHKAVFHASLMALLKDHTIQGRCILPGAGFV